ncbi:MAG: type II 3-dehydroquinate dehydratase [Alphaproteobacteria bacterium]|nr:type II 3-dehydroquinate dehydratase [Alphaproteobacteria bacterium]
MPRAILVVNGPNLNLLGIREVGIYGCDTLETAEKLCRDAAVKDGFTLDFKQSNSESELIEWIQEARDKYSAIVINAAAFSHTSIAILDALTLTKLPVFEVHVSNIFAREEFRNYSYISSIAKSVVCGCGIDGYVYAVQNAIKCILSAEKVV